jgi:transposase
VTQLKSRIKGYLFFVGVKIPQQFEGRRCWSNNFLKYLSTITFATDNHKYVMSNHINEIIHARTAKLIVLRRIREISKKIKTIGLLKTIPGIGPIVSFALYVELIDMKRFKDIDHVASYIGLVPSIQSSDKSVTVRGITFRHSQYLRDMMIESAWVAVRSDPALLSVFNELLTRMGKSEAIIRIAKKLLNRIRYVWLNQVEYVKGVVEVTKVKQK